MKATRILKVSPFPRRSSSLRPVAKVFGDSDFPNVDVKQPFHLCLEARKELPVKNKIYQEFKKFSTTIMPYEYRSGGKDLEQREKELSYLNAQSRAQRCQMPDDISDRRKEFHQFNAPLELLLSDQKSSTKIQSLYVAQKPIDELPQGMKELFPAPMDLINSFGRGDIYGSSIWIGNPPTNTPLHKDPNPNLFSQHLSSKKVRLLRPEIGTVAFFHVQRLLGTMASASFRGEEMMQGAEFEALDQLIWDPELRLEHFEVVVNPGETLFIPKGWWHSIKSIGTDLNLSVNWWFR